MAQAWIGLSWLFKHTCILLLPGPSALFLKKGQKTHRVPKELLGLKTQYQYTCHLDTIQLCLSKQVISRWPDYLLYQLFPLQGLQTSSFNQTTQLSHSRLSADLLMCSVCQKGSGPLHQGHLIWYMDHSLPKSAAVLGKIPCSVIP